MHFRRELPSRTRKPRASRAAHHARAPGASHPQNYQVTGFAYSSVASIPKSVEAACSAASLPE